MTADTHADVDVRTQIAALEQRLADAEQRLAQVRELFAVPAHADLLDGLRAYREQHGRPEQLDRLHMFELLIENVPDGIGIADFSGNFLYMNRANCAMYGYTEQELASVSLSDLEVPDDVPKASSSLEALRASGYVRYQTPNRRRDGSIFPAETTVWLLRNAAGEPVALGGITRDITEQVQQAERLRAAEAERAAMQERVIATQQAMLREVSTPLIPLLDGVVAMPLVGSVDAQRAQQILETLLDGVATSQASIAILDITGVSMVDTDVADALVRAAQAVKLLGATVMLTGIRPEVAQTLVNLGVDLGGIQTRSTLQSGIAEVIRKLQLG